MFRPLPAAPRQDIHPLRGVGQLVVFDLETTGLKAKKDRIIEVGAVRLLGAKMQVVDSFSTYADPDMDIPPIIQKLTKIKPEDVIGAPNPLQALSRLADFAENSVLFGHDIYQFDFSFIKDEISKAPGITTREFQYIDSMDIFQLIWNDFSRLNHGLDEIAERVHAGRDRAHRHTAKGDALLLAQIFQRIQTNEKLQAVAELVPVHTGYLPYIEGNPSLN